MLTYLKNRDICIVRDNQLSRNLHRYLSSTSHQLPRNLHRCFNRPWAKSRLVNRTYCLCGKSVDSKSLNICCTFLDYQLANPGIEYFYERTSMTCQPLGFVILLQTHNLGVPSETLRDRNVAADFVSLLLRVLHQK
jgi:hypothetical protein